METIVGIDPDTVGIAWCLARDGRPVEAGTVRRMKRPGVFIPGYERDIRDAVKGWRDAGAFILIEGAYLGKNPQTFRSLSEVSGELCYLLRASGIPHEFIQPSVWQRALFPLARRREEIAVECRNLAAPHFEDRILSDHEADATAIALFGCRRLAGAAP